MSASVKELHHHVKLNVECRLYLAMWLRFLTGLNGVALFLDKEVTKAADYALYVNNKSPGLDGITAEHLIYGKSSLLGSMLASLYTV